VDERPITRYATAPDGVSIAYQVTGDGPLDLVFIAGLAIPIDLMLDEPSFVRLAKRLGNFSRTVWSDPRGLGSSGGDLVRPDPVDGLVTHPHAHAITCAPWIPGRGGSPSPRGCDHASVPAGPVPEDAAMASAQILPFSPRHLAFVRGQAFERMMAEEREASASAPRDSGRAGT